jgi:biotin carboxylase
VARFVAFVSREAEVRELERRWPEHEFSPVAYTTVAQAVRLDAREPRAAFAALEQEHRQRPFAGVLNGKEKYVVAASNLSARLGLRVLVEDPMLVRDKYRMRQALSAAAPGPACCLLAQPSDLARVPESLFPAVLKPRFGFNSRSVVAVGCKRELAAALARHRGCFARLKRQDSDNLDFVVEGFIAGSEHSVDALVRDGDVVLQIVSDKAPMQAPFFVEVGDAMPSRLSQADLARVRDAVATAVRALGIRNAWAHVEVKLAADRAVVVEAAGREGGGYFAQLVAAVYGIDRWALLVELHLGTLDVPALEPRRAVVGRRIVTRGVTWVASARHAARAFALPGVRLVWPGEPARLARVVVGPPFGYKNTIVEFLATADTAEAAAALARRVEVEARLIRLPIPWWLYAATHPGAWSRGMLDG